MITENYKRKELGEGRDHGLGFAFLKKNKKDDYETRNAFTACKDYLNDLIYVENTEREIDKIHGFSGKIYKKLEKF